MNKAISGNFSKKTRWKLPEDDCKSYKRSIKKNTIRNIEKRGKIVKSFLLFRVNVSFF